MRIAILQTNPRVGDIEANVERALAVATTLSNDTKRSPDLFLLPELALIGYPARDVLSQSLVIEREARALDRLRDFTRDRGCAILVGHVETRAQPFHGRPFHNAATLFDRGEAIATVRKQRLPDYDIFDERRFFEEWSGPSQNPIVFRGLKIAVAICEDSWDTYRAFGVRDLRNYERSRNPWRQLAGPVDLLVNLSASPFALGKCELREDLFSAHAQRASTPVVYANCAGAQDHVLFDGRSFAIGADGAIRARAAAFREDSLVVELEGLEAAPPLAPCPRDDWADLRAGLVRGIADFATKCGAKKALLGISGGIDSALVATLAAQALGPDNVTGVILPSRFNSELSATDAQKLASNLGIRVETHPIQAVVDAAAGELGLAAAGLPYENLQARARGLLLMALANQGRGFLLATGNKSELAMGYSTLYGDMCGALMPIGDLYKTEVYGLSHYLNREAAARGETPPIPEFTLSRPPTAELAAGQKDEDSLPPYPVLDGVLFELIENQGRTVYPEATWNELLAPRFTVASIRAKMHAQEFKRHQAAPVLRVHQRAFSRGWSFPVAKGSL